MAEADDDIFDPTVLDDPSNPLAVRLKENPTLGQVGFFDRMSLSTTFMQSDMMTEGNAFLLQQRLDDPQLDPLLRHEYETKLQQIKRQRVGWTSMPPANSPMEYGANILGFGLGILTDPVNLLNPFWGKGGSIGSRMLWSGFGQSLVGAGADAAGQALAIGAGSREKYDPLQTGLVAGISGLAGGALYGVSEVATGIRPKVMPKDADTPEAKPASAASKAAGAADDTTPDDIAAAAKIRQIAEANEAARMDPYIGGKANVYDDIPNEELIAAKQVVDEQAQLAELRAKAIEDYAQKSAPEAYRQAPEVDGQIAAIRKEMDDLRQSLRQQEASGIDINRVDLEQQLIDAKLEHDNLVRLREQYGKDIAAARQFSETMHEFDTAPKVDDSQIKNPIDPDLEPEMKVAELARMTEEDRPIIEELITRIDGALGTKSKTSVKEPQKILEKANRPSIIEKKPWHDVEHIRDSLRFKTELNKMSDVPRIFEMLRQSGISIVKADVKKAVTPKEYGFPIIAFDLKMPNGHLVEYYVLLPEVEKAKKLGHVIFEKWRNVDEATLTSTQIAERSDDIARSFNLYREAFARGLHRTGETWADVLNSLNHVSRVALSSTSSQPPLANSPNVLDLVGSQVSPSSEMNALLGGPLNTVNRRAVPSSKPSSPQTGLPSNVSSSTGGSPLSPDMAIDEPIGNAAMDLPPIKSAASGDLQLRADPVKAQPLVTDPERAFVTEAVASIDANGKPVMETKHGLGQPYLMRVDGVDLPAQKFFAQKTTNANAVAQLHNISPLLERFPDAAASPERWGALMVTALKDSTVPMAPYNLIKGFQDGSMAGKIASLSPSQIEAADHGFANAQAFRQAYVSGRVGVEDTGKLFLWGILSRGVDPYTHEAMFLDTFRGIEPWIKLAAEGRFTAATLVDYLNWAKTAAPKGSGQPGAGTAHNLNAFGKNFLLKMGQIGVDGQTPLMRLHNAMSDPNISGKEIRRIFASVGEGVGIDNKVMSFILLVTGHKDVMVIDRIQMRNLWNDGRFDNVNIWDGMNYPRVVDANGDTVSHFPPNDDGWMQAKLNAKDIGGSVEPTAIPGSTFNTITSGARGLLIYEAIEDSISRRLPAIYEAAGRKADDAFLGRFHWDTWVAESKQEASHGSLDAMLRSVTGDTTPLAGVYAREGNFRKIAYGAKYGFDQDGIPSILYPDSKGVEHEFGLDAWRTFLKELKKPSNKVIPAGFGVEKSDVPWVQRPEVNTKALDSLIAAYANGGQYAAGGADRAGAPHGPRSATGEGLQFRLREAAPPVESGTPTATIEVGTTQTANGAAAHQLYQQALATGDTKVQQGYLQTLTDAMHNSVAGNAGENGWSTLMRAITGRADDPVIVFPTAKEPFSTGGTFEGAMSPNIRVSLKGMTDDQIAAFNAVAGEHLKQDAMAVSTVKIARAGEPVPAGMVRGHSLFVFDDLKPDEIKAFADALPEGHSISFTKHEGKGYQIDINPRFGDDGPVGITKAQVEDAFDATIGLRHENAVVAEHNYHSVYNEAGEYAQTRARLEESIREDFIREARAEGLSAKEAKETLEGGGAGRTTGAWDRYRTRVRNLAATDASFSRLSEDLDQRLGEFVKANQPDLQLRRATASQAPAGAPASAGGGKEVLSLQQQVNRLAETLRLDLRTGRVQHGALGQYSQGQDILRVQTITDFDTVSHEAGHALERHVGQPLSALINTHRTALGPLDYDVARQSPAEGFSEFVRHYLTSPAYAQTQAPQFYNQFEALMLRYDPEVAAALKSAQGAYADWLNAPGKTKIEAVVVSPPKTGIIADLKRAGMIGSVRLVLGKAYDTIWDNLAPVTRVQRSIYRAIAKATGTTPTAASGAANPEILMRTFARHRQAAISQLIHGVRGYHSVEVVSPSIAQAIDAAIGKASVLGAWDDAAIAKFNQFLVLKRAALLYDKFDQGLIPNPPLALTREEVTSALKSMASPQFETGAQMVHDYNRALLTKAFDAGLLDRKSFDQIVGSNEFYVPFTRDMSDKVSASKGGVGPTGQGDLIKRLKGSMRDIISPLDAITAQTIMFERTIAHNDIIKAFVNLAKTARDAGATGVGRMVEEIPAHQIVGTRFNLLDAIETAAKQSQIDPADTKVLMAATADLFGEDPINGVFFKNVPTSPRGEPITFYRDGGQLKAVRFLSTKEDALNGIYELVTAMPEPMRDWAVQTGALVSTVLRTGVVTNPVFALTNFIRDQFAAAILRPGYIPGEAIRGVIHEVAQDNWSQMYTYAGGVSPGAGAAGLERLIDGDIQALARKGWVVQKFGGTITDIKHGEILNALKNIGELVGTAETGTRLQVMKDAFNQKIGQGLSEYDAMIEAAHIASDLLDFGRHGDRMLGLRATVPFLNAALQGMDKWRRAMAPAIRSLYGGNITAQEKAAVASSWATVALSLPVGSALGYAYYLLMGDHEAYRDSNTQLRATHFILPGQLFGLDPQRIIVIPKPFELAMGFNMGELAAQGVAGDTRWASEARKNLGDILLPGNIIPPVAKLPIELALGKSMFTGKDIVPERLQGLAPAQQYTERTSAFAKAIGSALGVSPIKVEYTVGNLFGLWGRDIMALSNSADPNAPTSALEDSFFTRRFIKNGQSASLTTQRFWDLMAQRNGQFAVSSSTFKSFIDQGNEAKAREYLGALPEAERTFVTLAQGVNENGKTFKPEEKLVHPAFRAQRAIEATTGLIRELTIDNATHYENGERISLSPAQRRQAIDMLRVLQGMEQRNALVMLKDAGYEGRELYSTEDQFAVISGLFPEVAQEVATRYATAKVPPTLASLKAWNEARPLLMQDGSNADIRDIAGDLKSEGYSFEGERVKKPKPKRVMIPGR